MSSLDIQFEDRRTEFTPAATIIVTIKWSLSEPPDSVELRTVWNTVGKGTQDIEVENAIVVECPNTTDSRQIEVRLPEAPYSFSGKLISLVWALELVALPSNESCRKEIVIAPEGREVRLKSVSKPLKIEADG